MVQCEMCGAETPSPKTVKIEGAELQVCEDCADFGTEVRTETTSSTSTKYSTSSSSGTASNADSGSSSGGTRRRRGQDMLDDMAELAADYDSRIRNAREAAGLSQEELAGEMNEKASLIRKLERGEMLPSDDVQRKIERELGISLSENAGADEEEWSSDDAGQGLTLGDMVKRKD